MAVVEYDPAVDRQQGSRVDAVDGTIVRRVQLHYGPGGSRWLEAGLRVRVTYHDELIARIDTGAGREATIGRDVVLIDGEDVRRED